MVVAKVKEAVARIGATHVYVGSDTRAAKYLEALRKLTRKGELRTVALLLLLLLLCLRAREGTRARARVCALRVGWSAAASSQWWCRCVDGRTPLEVILGRDLPHPEPSLVSRDDDTSPPPAFLRDLFMFGQVCAARAWVGVPPGARSPPMALRHMHAH